MPKYENDTDIFCSSLLISRRAFLAACVGASAVIAFPRLCAADTGTGALEVGDPVPADKHLSQDWLTALFDRGAPTVYTGSSLDKIGMPIGGLCAGQLYLGGDGKLWRWNIFNQKVASPGEGQWYLNPPARDYPIDQGFMLRIDSDESSTPRNLDSTGFANISFQGQYPIGLVEYSDPACPVAVSLKAFSPFIPLDFDRSSFPATILRYTLHNKGAAPIKATIAGWMQNGVCLFSSPNSTTRTNSIVTEDNFTALVCGLNGSAANAQSDPDIKFETWTADRYSGWTVEGTAFGTGPIQKSDMPAYMGDVGGDTDHVANSHASAPGTTSQDRDSAVGKLISKPFVVARKYIAAWVGGGNHPGLECVNVVVDGSVVATATGADSNQMTLTELDVSSSVGKTATIEIVDQATGAWGNIGVGSITFTDIAASESTVSDYGTMALALLSPASETSTAGSAGALAAGAAAPSSGSRTTPLTGSIARTYDLKPGETATADFVVAWRFANLTLDHLGTVGNYYATKYATAIDVVAAIARQFESLATTTQLWHDTWYDSTLPYWFLDRTFGNTTVLATTTALRFANGRFYGWEGVGLGVGTCTHVWHYAHAVARLFPELERDTRQRVDLGIALVPNTGVIEYRAEFDSRLAVDGQAGTILRCYREHQMTTDNAFLSASWTKIKHAFDPLFNLDPNLEGILQGPQLNTLDFAWYGQISWLSSLYAAALRAGAAMASEMEDMEFETKCTTVADNAMNNMTTRLFNGEYYYSIPDASHPEAPNAGAGCEIDQVMGQSWASKVGLPRVLPKAQTVTALRSLYKYNFAPDVGPYRQVYPQGRWYAVAGEGGLLIESFPTPQWTFQQASGTESAYAAGYYNECQSGYEHNAAGHMISEGLVVEGLTVERAVHDRYNAAKRNPWNEIEYGDHYARSMASYGVYLAACGYQYHGPRASLTFAPQIGQKNAKFAFTTAEGWGSYSQSIDLGRLTAAITVKYGQLRLKTLTLSNAGAPNAKKVKVMLNGAALPATAAIVDQMVAIALPENTTIAEGMTLTLVLT